MATEERDIPEVEVKPESEEEEEKSSPYKGVVVANDQVASFHRRHGPPAFSKPHGASKTILYYYDPQAAQEAATEGGEEFKDFAGTETPNTKDLVLQGDPRGSINVSRVVRAGHAPRQVPAGGNPNRTVSNAPIENEGALDEKVTELEKAYMDKRLEQGPEALGEKVGKVGQEPVEETPDVRLPTDAPEEGPTYEPDVGRKKALGDTSSGGNEKKEEKGEAATPEGTTTPEEDALWEG